MSRALAFAGGALVGFAAGAILGAQLYIMTLTGSIMTPYLMLGNLLAGLAAGVLAGWKVSGRPRGIKLEGRFWRFPQGPYMVQVALKRMGSLVGGEGE